MSYTPFNAPLLAGLFGDMEIASSFSVKADITAMIEFEAALALAQGQCGLISTDNAEAISNACKTFEPNIKTLASATPTDGLIVPELVRQLRAHIGEPASADLHFGSTSQDAIDTSLMLRLKSVISIFENRLEALIATLITLQAQHENTNLMGRTRMQAALPIKASDRITNWRNPLQSQRHKLANQKTDLLQLQLAGPVGTLEKLGSKGEEVRKRLAEMLGLTPPNASWQTDRTSLADFCNWMAVTSGAIAKIGKDITLMSQQGIDEIKLSGGGSSSAMPHKQNPVKAEALVTLANYTGIQAGGFYQTLQHEQERSGSTWSLEWMLIPQICVATGASLRVATELIESIERMGVE